MKFNLENTSDSIWAIDKNYTILYLNDTFKTAYKEAFGIELRLGDNIKEKTPITIVDTWKERYKKALNGESYTFEDSVIDRHNNTIYYRVSFSPNIINNAVTGLTCFGRDVTNEKLNEIKLKKYSILLKSSLESQSKTIIFSIDTNFKYLYFNSAHYEGMKHAYNTEIKEGANAIDFITGDDDKAAAIENYTRVLKGESHSNIRIYGSINKEYYESFFNPIRDDNNNIIGVATLARNITKRIDQEEALKVANTTKDKFFSLISHDLRSPISSVNSLVNMLYNNFDEYGADELKSLLKIICNALDSTYTLLEDLLLWSRTQSNSITFKSEKINLSEISNTIINTLNQNFKNKGLIIKKNYPTFFNVNGDKQMLSTVIRNLLSNAIKFSHKQGKIEIGFHNIKEANDEKAYIYVSDSGVGISKKNITKLFNIGENTSTIGTDEEQGSGLGLVICKEFIDKHNGKITIDSEINKGTKISVILPQ